MIEKRAYSRLLPQFDEGHPTVSSIAPLIVFASTILVAVLLRLITFFGAITAWCIETDEFWYTSTGGNWPLIGAAFLVLFLLFVWNALIGFNDWRRSRGTKVMVVVNTLAIAAVFFVFGAIHDSANRFYNTRAGIYDPIDFQPFRIYKSTGEDECVNAHRYSGRWEVVDRHIGHYGFDIHADWIELNAWGYLYAQDASWSPVYADVWRPPYQSRFGWSDEWEPGYLFDAYWDFHLEGDTLTLTTPDRWFELEMQRSTITLRRVPSPDLPAYPNPHAAY